MAWLGLPAPEPYQLTPPLRVIYPRRDLRPGKMGNDIFEEMS